MALIDRGWLRLGLITPWSIEVLDPYAAQKVGAITAPSPLTRFVGMPAFSPDGTLLAATVDDGSVRVWDVETGKELRSLPGHMLGGCVAFSPDGKLLAAPGPKGEVVVWDVATGTRRLSLFEVQPYDGSCVVGFSPDGRYLVAMAAGSAALSSVVWDVATGQVVRIFPGPIVFIPDDIILLIDYRRFGEWVVLWDGVFGNKVREFLLPWRWRVQAMSVSRDGEFVAFGLEDGTIRLWAVAAGQELYKLNLRKEPAIEGEPIMVTLVSFSPDGSLLATGLWMPARLRFQIQLWYVAELVRAGP